MNLIDYLEENHVGKREKTEKEDYVYVQINLIVQVY